MPAYPGAPPGRAIYLAPNPARVAARRVAVLAGLELEHRHPRQDHAQRRHGHRGLARRWARSTDRGDRRARLGVGHRRPARPAVRPAAAAAEPAVRDQARDAVISARQARSQFMRVGSQKSRRALGTQCREGARRGDLPRVASSTNATSTTPRRQSQRDPVEHHVDKRNASVGDRQSSSSSAVVGNRAASSEVAEEGVRVASR